MDKWLILLIVVAALAGLLCYGVYNGKQLRDQKVTEMENALGNNQINLVHATLYRSVNVIVYLNESEFLNQAKGQTVYEYSTRFIFFSSDWKIQYEYDVNIFWSLGV